MRVQLRGLVFDMETAGDPAAPLVLLLHGFPQTSHTWRAELRALEKRGYFAVAPNQRGYSPGARPRGTAQYATELLLADALGFADLWEARRFHLVGHDWGGQLAWLVAARHPERLSSLTVLSRPHPASFAESMKTDPDQPKRSGHHTSFLDEQAADRLLENGARRLRTMLSRQGVSELDIEAYLSQLGSRDALNAAIDWYRAARTSDSALVGSHVPSVSVPTLYLWGENDATVGEPAARATRRFASGPYALRVIPGGGHFLTDDGSPQVTESIERHIQHWSR